MNALTLRHSLSRLRGAACVALLSAPALACAAPAQGAMMAPDMTGSAVPSLGVGAVLQTLLGLVLVIGLVFGCAWLARRAGFQTSARGGALKVVSSVAVGGKERATLVEIGDTWLVLGVAPGNVRLLHSLPAGAAAQAASGAHIASDAALHTALTGLGASSSSFGRRFREALVGEARKRLTRSSH